MKSIPWQQAVKLDSTLRYVAQGWARRPVFATALVGGTTNQCWQITTECGRHFVWRPASSSIDVLAVSRTNEYQVLTALYGADFAPNVERFISQGLLVEWFEGQVLTDVNLTCADKKHYVVSALAQTHQFSSSLPDLLQSSISRFDYHQSIEHYWQHLGSTEMETGLEDLFSSLGRIDPRLNTLTHQLAPQCVCHFDIGLYNLIKMKAGVGIIDWEYAALSSPVIDLAFCITNSDLSVHDSVDAYCELRDIKRSNDWQQAVEHWLPHVQFISKLWFLLSYKITGKDDYKRCANKILLG